LTTDIFLGACVDLRAPFRKDPKTGYSRTSVPESKPYMGAAASFQHPGGLSEAELRILVGDARFDATLFARHEVGGRIPKAALRLLEDTNKTLGPPPATNPSLSGQYTWYPGVDEDDNGVNGGGGGLYNSSSANDAAAAAAAVSASLRPLREWPKEQRCRCCPRVSTRRMDLVGAAARLAAEVRAREATPATAASAAASSAPPADRQTFTWTAPAPTAVPVGRSTRTGFTCDPAMEHHAPPDGSHDRPADGHAAAEAASGSGGGSGGGGARSVAEAAALRAWLSELPPPGTEVERPQRIAALVTGLAQAGLLDKVELLPGRRATTEVRTTRSDTGEGENAGKWPRFETLIA